eukprot:PhM_4_TR4531/c0_g1_i1/m.61955
MSTSQRFSRGNLRDFESMSFDQMAASLDMHRDMHSMSSSHHTQQQPYTLTQRRQHEPRDIEARDILRGLGMRAAQAPPPSSAAIRGNNGGLRDADPLADATYESLLALDENNVSRAAPPSLRRRYLRAVLDPNPKESCLICQDEYGTSRAQRVVSLPCSHTYHDACINKWFDKEKTCPVCRKELGER